MTPPLNPDSTKQKRLDAIARKVGALESARGALEDAVRLARQANASWTEIGTALGTTKQNAQQRFGGS